MVCVFPEPTLLGLCVQHIQFLQQDALLLTNVTLSSQDLCSCRAARGREGQEETENERGDGEKEEEEGEGENPRMERDLGAISHLPRKCCTPLPFPSSLFASCPHAIGSV